MTIMGFRFRRSLRLGKGASLNLSRSGPSLSFGRRGARVTIGPGRTRYTVGLPGTGLSYTATSGHHRRRRRVRQHGSVLLGLFLLYLLGYVLLHMLGIVG
jgi:hypothetical protein